MISSQKRSCSSAVIGAKSARACDSCLLKRARWYCAADDAFLCQGCDSSVHSANQLASRHERVRLNTSSSMITKGVNVLAKQEDPAPAWHRGFTRKARTPRNPSKSSMMVGKKEIQSEKLFSKFSPLIVPEMGSDESTLEETEEQLLFRVPVFDPFDTEFCDVSDEQAEKRIASEMKELFDDGCPELDGFQGFLPSDMELAEFAADVESLLGTEGNEDNKDRTKAMACFEGVKIEEEEIEAILACQFDPMMGMAREALDWQFEYDSLIPSDEDMKAEAGEENTMTMMTKNSTSSNRVNMERRTMLTLNYEGVITAWASHGCPWTNGIRPQFDPNASLSDLMGISLANITQRYGDRLGGVAAGNTGEREARVLRYREKRRTRMFSKKIRYEVRKLNAEKRPRMKGRFVKRSSFAGKPSLNRNLTMMV